MYALMCYQIAPTTECFITHITSIRAVTTMYVSMSYQTALVTECLITYITSIRAFTTMYASMCYKTALLSEGPITHFTCIWTLIPMYNRGISAFSTNYVKLFILSTLVKPQNLNIRIYFDRKNNIFIAMYTFNKNPLHLKSCYLKKCISDK